MGVTHSIKKVHNCTIEALNEFLMTNMPPYRMFVSNLGQKAFNTEFPILVKKSYSAVSHADVGSVSELFIDTVIGRYVNMPTKREIFDAIVSSMLGKTPVFFPYKDSDERIIKCLDIIKQYIQGCAVNDELVVESLFTVYKHGKLPCAFLMEGESKEDIYFRIFEKKVDKETISEIVDIGALFLRTFTSTGYLKKDSRVVIKPRFAHWSEMLGAEGDLYIDGILYDIKSRIREGRKRDEIAQVYGYYLCSVLGKYYGILKKSKTENGEYNTLIEASVNMENEMITGIGVYLSRFGEIAICDIASSNSAISKEMAQMLILPIVNNKESRYAKLEEMLGTDTVSHIEYEVFNKLIFQNIPLEKDVYGKSSLLEYVDCVYPITAESNYDITNKEPIMWCGEMPREIEQFNLFYIIHFKASFKLKRGKSPFVNATRSFLFRSATNMSTSDYYDKKTQKYYRYYRNYKGDVEESLAEIFMTREDFELFKKSYNIRTLNVLDGCYFR